MAARNGRWEIAPPPRILNLPQRSRRSRATAPPEQRLDWKLGELLDQELSATPTEPPSPLTWGMSSGETVGDSSGEERWRFQAEILRAECNFLRMEREVALRKLERNRARMEVALKSAMETLVSGRKKIDGRAAVGAALDEGSKSWRRSCRSSSWQVVAAGGGNGRLEKAAARELQKKLRPASVSASAATREAGGGKQREGHTRDLRASLCKERRRSRTT
ncbi:unnamed protein product [Musa banksii]